MFIYYNLNKLKICLKLTNIKHLDLYNCVLIAYLKFKSHQFAEVKILILHQEITIFLTMIF